MVGRLGMNELIEVRLFLIENDSHFVRPLLFVIHVGVVEVLTELMLEDPAELAINEQFVGIPRQTIVPQQLDAFAHPTPAIREILELD